MRWGTKAVQMTGGISFVREQWRKTKKEGIQSGGQQSFQKDFAFWRTIPPGQADEKAAGCLLRFIYPPRLEFCCFWFDIDSLSRGGGRECN